MAELFLALAQRFFGDSALLHLADKIVALLEEFLGRPGQLTELGVVPAETLDRLRIVFLQCLHDLAERLAYPTHDRPRNQEQENERENEKPNDHPLVRSVQKPDDRHFIPDHEIGGWVSVPARQGFRE